MTAGHLVYFLTVPGIPIRMIFYLSVVVSLDTLKKFERTFQWKLYENF